MKAFRAVATVLPLLALLVLPATRASADSRTVDCSKDPSALQPAIDVAAPGDVLRIVGTCTGTFTISQDLTLFAGTLDAEGAGTTVTVTGGEVLLRNTSVTGGEGSRGGGSGIVNAGNLTLSGTIVTGNHGDGASAVRNTGVLRVIHSSIVSNGGSADDVVGVSNDGGRMDVRYSAVSQNSSTGIINDAGGRADVLGTRIDHDGTGGSAGTGGVANLDGKVSLSHSTVSENAASGGSSGGVYNAATLRVIDSTVANNRTGDAANVGAGLVNDAGASMSIMSSTISGNNSDAGGAGVLAVKNTVVGGVATWTKVTASITQACDGKVRSGGYNVMEASPGCRLLSLPSDAVGSLPELSSLGNYGGPTQTMPPVAPSVAIDAIPQGATDDKGRALCPATGATDQRFIGRPQGAACDIGAVEVTA
ncbi:MAG TPA: choice-of-anchor Q domain-containing protein [Actinomycetota bacterium]|jgi:hypothetical protein|nr:choice-of-anchor Q domain-containing protein [Actinomycetota bacterium]